MNSKKMQLNKNLTNNLITYGLVIAAFFVVQGMIWTGKSSSLMQGLLVPLCVYVILAVSLNLTVGILGELSLGHAGFMCVGAFASAFFSKCVQEAIPNSGLRFFLAILIGAAAAGLFGILIGIPVLRLKGDYLAIVTLAFGEIIKNIINVLYIGKDGNGFHFSMKDAHSLHMESDGVLIINGAQGITGTPKDSSFIIGVALVLITLWIVLNIIHSETGERLCLSEITALRRNPLALISPNIS